MIRERRGFPLAVAMAFSPLPTSMALSSSPAALHRNPFLGFLTPLDWLPALRPLLLNPFLQVNREAPSFVAENLSVPIPVGECGAGLVVEPFPALHLKVLVRNAQLRDYWQVADTYCSSFYPEAVFPLDLLLRTNRFLGLLNGLFVPPGCSRAYLVAVAGGASCEIVDLETETLNLEAFGKTSGLGRGSVDGILTVDNAGDLLPRRGPLRQRRTTTAYISGVAVREEHRRKGIAKRLVSEAVVIARSWGCRAVALHCDADDIALTKLYEGLGFRSIKVPAGADWPEPAYPGTRFRLMMKLCTSV